MAVYKETHGDSSRPSLVLLHGWGMDSRIWQGILPLLAPYFSVTTIDLPGLGRSDSLPSHTLSAVAKTVAAEVERPSIWLGWSLGGMVASQVAVDYPEQVLGLVTVASNPCFVQREGWKCAMPEETYQQFKELVMAHPKKALARFNLLQVQGSHNSKVLLNTLKSLTDGVKSSALVDMLILLESDYRELVSRVEKPVLHLLGSADALVPASLAEGLEGLVPEQDVQMVSASGHLPFLAFPQAFVGSLAIFTRTLPKS